MYDLSPMMVQLTEHRRSLTHFLTGVCAIVGGVFTVAGMLDGMLYHSTRALKKKIDLGKASWTVCFQLLNIMAEYISVWGNCLSFDIISTNELTCAWERVQLCVYIITWCAIFTSAPWLLWMWGMDTWCDGACLISTAVLTSSHNELVQSAKLCMPRTY